MAITKIIGAIHPPKSGNKHASMKRAIDYVLNPKKTDSGRLTGSHNCFTFTALDEMISTKQLYGKDGNSSHERQAYHYTISWSPEENISAEQALEVLQEFVDEYLGNEYEVVYSIHNDHEHMHGHIVFNSVNLRDGRKFRYEDGDWAKIIQPLVDEICVRHGLHTLSQDTGMSISEYEEERKEKKARKTAQKRRENVSRESHSNNRYHKDQGEKYSWNEHIKEDIDYAILNSDRFEEFESHLKEMGYQIKYGNSEKYGKSMKLKAPGMDIYRRTYALGVEYTLRSIEERIAIRNKPLPVIVLPISARTIIPVRYYTKYRKIPLNPALRRYYRSLYRLGIKPNYPKRNYRVSKEAVALAERTEQKLLLRLNDDVSNYDDAVQLKEKQEQELEILHRERKALYEKHKPYEKMLKAYKAAQSLKVSYEEYVQGDESKMAQALEYEKHTKLYQKYGFSDEEIEEYKKSRSSEFKEMKERIRKQQVTIDAAKDIIVEYATEIDDAFTPEEEQFYNSIPIEMPSPQINNNPRI